MLAVLRVAGGELRKKSAQEGCARCAGRRLATTQADVVIVAILAEDMVGNGLSPQVGRCGGNDYTCLYLPQGRTASRERLLSLIHGTNLISGNSVYAQSTASISVQYSEQASPRQESDIYLQGSGAYLDNRKSSLCRNTVQASLRVFKSHSIRVSSLLCRKVKRAEQVYFRTRQVGSALECSFQI